MIVCLFLSGCAVWLLWPLPQIGDDRQRLMLAATCQRSSWVPRLLSVIAAFGCIAIAMMVFPRMVLTILTIAIPIGTGIWWWTNERKIALVRKRQEDVSQMALSLAACLRSGQLPLRALEFLSSDFSILHSAVAAHRIGADVSDALCREADLEGAEGMGELAKAWRLAETTGAPIAQMAEKIASQLRSDAATMRTVGKELSSSKATSLVFCALPGIGIFMAFLSGGNPFDFLFGTTAGQVVLLCAVCLACAGLAMMSLLAHPRRFSSYRVRRHT